MPLFLDLDDPRSPLPPTASDIDIPFVTFDGIQGHLRKRSIPDVPIDIEFSFEDLDAPTNQTISPYPRVQERPQFGDPFASNGRRGSWIDSPDTSNSSMSPVTEDRLLESEFSCEGWSAPSAGDPWVNGPRSPSGVSRVRTSRLGALALNVKPLWGPMFSELEVETQPDIFKHNYVIIRKESHVGPCPLRYGEDGFLSLKSFASNTTTATLWLSLQGCAICEQRDDPDLRTKTFFEDNATLIFVERENQYTKSGDPLFEFLGNYYVRTKADDAKGAAEDTRALWVSTLRQSALSTSALSGIPLSAASRVELQFIR